MLLAAGAAMVAGLGMAGPASATKYKFTFHGTVEANVPSGDGLGLFGGGSLAGDQATAQFVFDDTRGESLSGFAVNGHPGTEYIGGPAFGATLTDPLLSATLTINGMTADFYSPNAGFVGIVPGYYLEADSSGPSGNPSLGAGLLGAFPDPLANATVTGSTGGGLFSDCSTPGCTSGDVDYTSVDIRVLSVPEPGVWSMMLLGVAAVGGFARARRRERTALA